MAAAISFGDTNSGLQAGTINGPVNAEFHHYHPERSETPPHPSAFLPFARDRDFVERGELLEQIHQKCAVPGSRIALVGLGGVGKSQLAIEHAYQIREQSSETWVFWVHASSVARFEQSYRDIAEQVKILGRKDPQANILKLVHDWLRDAKNGSWLLVLDNVDDTYLCLEAGGASQRAQGKSQPMSAYLPQSQNGSILITSRSKAITANLVEDKDIILVDPMTQSHALALFEKKLGSVSDGDDVVELAAALEYMPLAIVQSAAYIYRRAPRCSVRQYLQDFRKSDSKKTSLLNYGGGQLRRDWDAKNSIIITWQISFEYIRQTSPSAADLLSLMSFFDRQGIPEFLIRNGSQTQPDQHEERESGERSGENSESDFSDDDRFEKDVKVLRDYSFISCDTDRTFEMHALVQLAMRKWLDANQQLESWKQQYVQKLSVAFPFEDYKNWTRCQALFPHAKSAIAQRPKAEGSLSAWASLMYNAAWYAYMKGNTAEAIQLFQTALEGRKKILGQEHLDTLRAMVMVALVYSSRDQVKEAEELQIQVTKTRRKILGEEHPETLYSVAGLVLISFRQGRWKEAEKLGIHVLEIEKRVLGEEHPYTLASINHLAMIYYNQRRWKEAEELVIHVLEIEKRVLGEEHLLTLTSMIYLSVTYIGQGRWEEAEELYVHLLEIGKRVLGEEHPHTLSSMADLAYIWKAQGKTTKAIDLMGECERLQTRILGSDHPDTLSYSKALSK